MGATYFLLRGLRKVTGEVAFFGVGHNIERIPPITPKNQAVRKLLFKIFRPHHFVVVYITCYYIL